MSFAVLERQVRELPLDLQKNIEMYALFVINQYKNSCPRHNRRPIAEVVDSLSGVIGDSGFVTMKEIRRQRLAERESLA